MTLIFTGLTGALVISILVPFFWTWLSLSQWLLLISLAAIGTLAHFLLILSLTLAEASKLAPLSYSEIIMNVIILALEVREILCMKFGLEEINNG